MKWFGFSVCMWEVDFFFFLLGMLLTFFNSWEILVCDEVSLLGTVYMGYDVLLLLSPRYILCIVLWFVSWSSHVGPLCLKQADGDAFTILCVSSSMQSAHIPKLIFCDFSTIYIPEWEGLLWAFVWNLCLFLEPAWEQMCFFPSETRLSHIKWYICISCWHLGSYVFRPSPCW